MRSYECLYIVHPAADSVELEKSTGKYTELITEKGGVITKVDPWGKRKLAYEIDKVGDGNFILLRFQAEPDTIAELEFRMRVDDRVLRYMTSYEIAEGAGRSDELMVLTERKERERRGRGRGGPRGGGGGGRGGGGGGGYRDRGPRRDEGDSERRPPAAAPQSSSAGSAPSAPAPKPSEGGSE